MMKLLGLLLVVCCGAGIGVMQAMRLRSLIPLKPFNSSNR